MTDLKTFHESVKKGDLEAVRAGLAQHAVWLDELNEAGQNAFVLAKYYRQEGVAEYLLGLRPKLDVFSLSIAGREADALAEIDRNPALLEAHSSDGWTPLHLAAFFGHVGLANALVDRGAAVNSRSTNPMKNTPLHAASAGGHLTLVELLLKRGANPNATQEGGWTALHGAAQSGHREMVEALLAGGADANLRASNQQTALDMALMKGHQDIASMLEALTGGGQ
ncbi:MAG TPA: ankyrin repeat domain-containing protein [Bryobacteraceae bacterium]|jgi:ankyrin repeat protein